MKNYKNLKALLEGLKAGDFQDQELTDLPTFGGKEPTDTTGIWSWDADQLLVGDEIETMTIIPRPMPRYVLLEEGCDYVTVEAPDADTALREARDNVDADNYDIPQTIWVSIAVRNVDDPDDTAESRVRLDPEEPKCVSGLDHDWCSPEFLGGCCENPGVFGHGGGAVIHRVCKHCGIYRVTDTWAQDRETGEEGLRSVEYKHADDDSREWIEEQLVGEVEDAIPQLGGDIRWPVEVNGHTVLVDFNHDDKTYSGFIRGSFPLSEEKIIQVAIDAVKALQEEEDE